MTTSPSSRKKINLLAASCYAREMVGGWKVVKFDTTEYKIGMCVYLTVFISYIGAYDISICYCRRMGRSMLGHSGSKGSTERDWRDLCVINGGDGPHRN